MLLMIDNYDSFTYNLVQYFGELGAQVEVFRNDEITIEDTGIYTKPWNVAFPFSRDPGAQIFEYACHEGNYAMAHILSGARAEEKAAAEAAKAQK